MPEPQDELHQLADELQLTTARLVKKLRGKSPTHAALSLTEVAVMKQLIRHPQLLPSELAAAEKVSTQAMSQILRHLEELGYITRQALETDRRKVGVALSAGGQAMRQAVKHEGEAWLQAALARHCSPAEQEQLRQVLPLLHRLIEAE